MKSCGDSCPAPNIEDMEVTQNGTFQTKLMADAKVALSKIKDLPLDAEVGATVENLLKTSRSTTVSQDFYEWYQSNRLKICSLMSAIESAENAARPDILAIARAREQLIEFIVSFDSWEKRNDDILSEQEQLAVEIEQVIQDEVIPKIRSWREQARVTIDEDKMLECRRKIERYQTDLAALNELLLEHLPRTGDNAHEIEKVRQVFEQLRQTLG